MDYQFDHLRAFIKKLTQPTKTPSQLNLESWAEFAMEKSASSNYDRGYDKCYAQISVEARKLLIKIDSMQAYPYSKRPARDLEPDADTNITRVGPLMPKIPPAVDDPLLSLKEIEKAHIIRVLHVNGFNKTRTAKSLGITVKTLYNKFEEYKIESPECILKGKPGRKVDHE